MILEIVTSRLTGGTVGPTADCHIEAGWWYCRYCKIREVDMKQYGFIDPTYYVSSNVFR